MLDAPPPAVPLCTGCKKEPVVPKFKPFCSDRCKMADLGRWLSGEYAVPAIEPPDEFLDDELENEQ